ncbi:MAG: PQQ-binding-like beta-propeller repeat protein, partial [bacterium]|nr:PQQ-binding-like beta-propeller repeat protein [bacterium]
ATARLGDLLFVCDRGYQLGAYSADGSPGNKWLEQVSAIAPDASGQYLLARTTDDRVCKFDATGKKVWETTVAAGRFPIPPTVANDHVYVCSNQGRLSVLDATDGRVTGTYQVTPGFYVMAPVAVDSEGCCYVAGMDGSVTAVETEGGRPGGGR